LSGAVAQRYAAALADVVLKQNGADAAKADLAAFSDAFYSSPDLRNFLESPAIGEQAKPWARRVLRPAMGVVKLPEKVAARFSFLMRRQSPEVLG